jgi:ubiquinone/menaquinone biosynthesis C-methylase UbiE
MTRDNLRMRRYLTEWDRILPESVYSPEEPDETVVDFADSLRRRSRRTLDLACGAGRHVVFMAKRGFEVCGVDISGMGLRMTEKRLKKQELRASLVKSVMNHLPFVHSSFDAVICTRAVYHQTLQGIQETLLEIRKVLRKGGVILIDFLSKRTYSYGKGVEVERETFVETEGYERGVMHHFTDQNEIQRLFEDFKILSMDLREKDVEGKLRSRLIVQAMKY